MKIAIFDLDGTLADPSHRLHLLENKDDPLRWRKFYRQAIHDRPIEETIRVFRLMVEGGIDVRVWTARSDEILEGTEQWLVLNTGVPRNEYELRMRKANDRTPDHVLKKQWFREMPEAQQKDVFMVFEDRTRVVNMWRSLGLRCLQVAPGDF